MTVTVFLEYRFDRTPDGRVWSQTAFAYSFWQRYLEMFDSVRVVARVRDVDRVPVSYLQASGDGVEFAAVTHYLGPTDYVRKRARVRRDVEQALTGHGAVILRVPGQLGTIAADHLMQAGRPFGVAVVGDPYDVFTPGAVKHPLRPYFRWQMAHDLRRICKRAAVAAYVTESALQRRYPASNAKFVTHFSDVTLPEGAFQAKPRRYGEGADRTNGSVVGSCRLVAVGSLEQMYKSPDILLRAVKQMAATGACSSLTWIGDGKHRLEMEALARRLGILEKVCFVGQVTEGEAVRRHLDEADVFVLPSRTEGLPRAMIEAMARGLPCIGSTVGGIPELLPPEDMVPPGDVKALADKIVEVVRDSERLTAMSACNLRKAMEYRDEVLKARRDELYARLRDVTEAYFAAR